MNRTLFMIPVLLLTSGAALGQERPRPAPKLSPALVIPSERPSVFASDEGGEMAAAAFETVLRHGAFVSFDVEYSQVLGADAWFAGLKGGWIANHRFILGLAGFAMANGISPPRGAPTTATNVRIAHGGLWLEYVFFHDKPVHGSLGALLGGGQVSYTSLRRRYPAGPGDNFDFPSSNIFVFEPSASLELNLSRIVRLSAGVGYRTVANTTLEGLTNDDLSSLTGAVRLKLGVF